MLANADGLLDQVVEILRKVWRETLGLKDAQNLAAGDKAHLGDSVRITKNDTDLRRGETLLGQLEDLLFHIFGREFEPLKIFSKNSTSRQNNSFIKNLANDS